MAINRINTLNMSRAEWLELRKTGVGGSDLASIIGMNRYRGMYAVWAEKTGKIHVSDRDNEAMRIGRDLEQYVAERFCEKSGKKVRRVNYMLSNDDYPHIQCNIDREVSGENAILECKTANAYGRDKFEDGIPEEYLVQCATYMAVTQSDRCYLAALIMGMEFKIYMISKIPDDPCPEWCEKVIRVDEEDFQAIRTAAIEFWKYVESGEEPPVDATPETSNAIKEMYPRSNDAVSLDAGIIGTELRMITELKKQKKDLEGRINELESVVKNFMKDAATATSDKFKVSYKTSSRTTLDSKKVKAEYPEAYEQCRKESETRTLRITEVK